EVLTGDSVKLVGGKTLRYIGLRSAPLQHLWPLVRQYGKEALDFNKSLVEGKDLYIEWGPQLREDRSQILLGYVFLEDGTFVNDKILEVGCGKISIKPPNSKYAERLRKSELAARRQKLGMWREEANNPFIQNDYYGDKNTKLFYFANHPDLERIPQSYIVTFRSRVEAVAAGYKPCSTCKEAQMDLDNSL
ncbi:MAG: thermonuclease family protein, partial [Candidatus Omnitrophota bacterium]